jgi:hypothetical protein
VFFTFLVRIYSIIFSKTLFQFFVRHLSSYEKKKVPYQDYLPFFYIYFILLFFWDDFGFCLKVVGAAAHFSRKIRTYGGGLRRGGQRFHLKYSQDA